MKQSGTPVERAHGSVGVAASRKAQEGREAFQLRSIKGQEKLIVEGVTARTANRHWWAA